MPENKQLMTYYNVKLIDGKLVIVCDNGRFRYVVKPPLIQRFVRAWRDFRQKPHPLAKPVPEKMTWVNVLGRASPKSTFVKTEFCFVSPVIGKNGRPVFKDCEPVTCVKMNKIRVQGSPEILKKVDERNAF